VPGVNIRNQLDSVGDNTSPMVSNVSTAAAAANKRMKRRIFKSKKRLVRNALVITNATLLMAIGAFIFISRPSDIPVGSPQLSVSSDKDVADPLDSLSSADIAVNIAQLTRMDEITAVANNADTINSQLDIVSADSQVVAKPQIITTDVVSVSDVQTYVSVEGDTVTKIAEKFGVSKGSIRWSNDLSGDAIAAGTTLDIPPVDGLIYTVKDGDTAASVARKYSADEQKIVAFNDAEITGLVAGDQIVIPDGAAPSLISNSIPNYTGFRHGGNNPVYGYNGYDYGYCTWYSSHRRAEVGKPIPANLGNASTWKVLSQRAGIPVSNTPHKYAVIWTPPRDYYGHVGFVEEVYPNGSIRVSEMNVRGWGVRSEKVLTAAQASSYSYIY
jgi:surface antigen